MRDDTNPGASWAEGVIEHAPEAMVVYRKADGRILAANVLARRLYGYHDRGLEGRDFRLIAGERDPGEANGSYRTAHVRKDGSLVLVDAKESSFSSADGTAAIVSLREVDAGCEATCFAGQRCVEYQDLFEDSPVAMWIHDPQTLRVLAINRNASGLYGYRLERKRDLTVSDLCGHKPSMPFQDGIGEHRTVAGNRTRVSVGTRKVRYFGQDATLVVVQNISEHELLLQEFSNRETWYRCIIENTLDIISVLDPQGRIVWESPSVQRVVGRGPGGKRNAFEHIHPDDLPGVLRIFSSSLNQDGVTDRAEFRVRHENGTWRWLEAIGHNLLAHPAVHGIVIHSRDITERRRTEEALRRSEEMSRMAQLAGQVGVWEYDVRTDTAICSDQNNALYGMQADELVTLESWSRYLHPEDAERVVGAFVRTSQTGDLFSEEFRVVLPDGSVRWLAARAEARRGADGQVSYMAGVNIDVTDRKATERELSGARDKAVEASRLKSQFLATVSHEIRTPMNGIIGMIGLLLDSPLTTEQRADAETIRTSAMYLLDLINDLLDFSRLEAGKLQVEACPFDLRDCLDTVVDLLTPAAAAKRLMLGLTYQPGMPCLWQGNAGRIRQIVLNFASNAVKFTDNGYVRIGAVRTATGVRIVVRDTGPGISEASQKQLFQKFVQLDGTSTRRHGGTGLGLAISKALAEAMGGSVGVCSVVGVGSQFYVELPLKPVSIEASQLVRLPAQRPASPALVAEGRTVRILVVEDNLVNQKLAVRLLEKRGYRADVAGDGREAIEMWKRLPYDLILMDCQMPELDGFAATRVIRRAGGTRSDVPIVAVTAHAGGDERAECVRCGMNDVLTKPFQPHQLDAILTRWLSEARLDQQIAQ